MFNGTNWVQNNFVNIVNNNENTFYEDNVLVVILVKRCSWKLHVDHICTKISTPRTLAYWRMSKSVSEFVGIQGY